MTTRSRFVFVSALALCASVATRGVLAADGTAGSSSTGQVDVLLSVQTLVQVSQLNDINLGAWDGTQDLTGTIAFCVWTNAPGRAYSLQATGSGNSFSLSNGQETAPMQVAFANPGSGSGAQPMTHGVPLTGLNAGTMTADCSNGTARNAQLTVSVTSADMAAVKRRNQQLTGTLTLTVQPE